MIISFSRRSGDVMLDNLVSRYIRHLSHRLMNFESPPGDVRLPEPDSDRGYLLYLHIPFCVVLCPFCSFHRVEFRAERASQYFEALQQEILQITERGYRFEEVYIGGGTPTVLPDMLVDTVELIMSSHPVTAVSVETNPQDLNLEKLARLKASGVNRLSVGVQSFDDQLLKEMDRYENYGSGAQISEHLQQVAGTFDTLNVDMIFNFPHQDEKALSSDLRILTDEISVDQVSWYPLMVSDSTSRPIARRMGSIDHSRERAFYERIVAHMLGAGYQRSSAWCFSRKPGMFDEYIVEHEEYVGLGSGSFSYLDGAMYASTFSINHYLRRVHENRTGTVRQRGMTAHEQMRYFLLMQLFSGKMGLKAGEERFPGAFDKTMWRDLAGLRLIGAIRNEGDVICLTEYGYYLWVVLMREFFSGVNSFRDDMRHNIARETDRKHADYG